jgi:nucleoid DNA-binding protein
MSRIIKDTITRKLVADKQVDTIKKAKEIVDSVFAQVTQAIENGNGAHISGLGTFKTHTIKARSYVLPDGSREAKPARTKVKFKPSSTIKVG